ncbi:Janus/Ocnus family protein [Nitzschia inconspicua]|uniref:Janus/Ocnus family protein n=1 Tax=Nitzschia inconspicua TaxID=303405 RepID=A0A9K3Q542_9STRA|nr:Janus/Ocnus family protein [Nitzschia inconspicua]
MEENTTNEEDQQEAARLQARLRQQQVTNNDVSSQEYQRLPNVSIDKGKHKYVLISAKTPSGERQHFVVSKKGAAYHRDAAEPFVEALERCGYKSIDIQGGGRIHFDTQNKTINVYGYSYGFGLADHALSKSVIVQDPRFQDYDVTWSNEGY